MKLVKNNWYIHTEPHGNFVRILKYSGPNVDSNHFFVSVNKYEQFHEDSMAFPTKYKEDFICLLSIKNAYKINKILNFFDVDMMNKTKVVRKRTSK